MLHVTDRHGGLLTITASGKLTQEDYEGLQPDLDQWVAEHGRWNGVVILDGFTGWEPAAAWEDLKAAVRLWRHLGRIALVADTVPAPHLMQFLSALWPGEYRSFDRAHLDEARAWAADGEGSAGT